MPRRKKEKSKQRLLSPDPVYDSLLVQKFINVVMKRGKKNIARSVVYGSIDVLLKKANGDKEKALESFNQAFKQVVPAVEVRSRRVGGSVCQVPREVSPDRSMALGIRWIIGAAKARSGKTMSIRLAHELMDAYEGRGAAVKKKIDVHRMAEANRAFSHYAW